MRFPFFFIEVFIIACRFPVVWGGACRQESSRNNGSVTDEQVPFFIRSGFSRKITLPRRIYSRVLTSYDNALLVRLSRAACRV